MKTGTSMSGYINTRKSKKDRKMTKCNCKVCVNMGRKVCHFGWEPIKGKCNRYATNQYNITKEEHQELKRKAKEHNNKDKAIRATIEKEMSLTTVAKLNQILETNVSLSKIMSCKSKRYFGNGKFSVKCVDPENQVIIVRNRKGQMKRLQITDS